MFLADIDIVQAMKNGDIKIDPFEKNNLQSASLDLRLGRNFLIPDYHTGKGIIDLSKQQSYLEKNCDEIIIPSGEFILGTTLEYISISPKLISTVEGRSSIGRQGLFIQNAGWIDPGFEGNITLEFFNANKLPIILNSGRRICQLVFAYTKTPSENPYSGKYKGQRGTTGSKAHLDYEVKKL